MGAMGAHNFVPNYWREKRNAAGIVIVKKTYHLHLENLEWETISELTA